MKSLKYSVVLLCMLILLPMPAMSKDHKIKVKVTNFPEVQQIAGAVDVLNLATDAEGRLIVVSEPQPVPEIYAFMTDVQVGPGSRLLTKQVSVPSGKRLVIQQLGLSGTAPDWPAPQNGELFLDLGPTGDKSRPHFMFVIERVRLIGSEHLLRVAPQRVSFMLDGPRTFQLRVERDQTWGWYITWINLYGYLVDLPQ